MRENATHAVAARIPVARPGAPIRSRRGRSAPDRSGAGFVQEGEAVDGVCDEAAGARRLREAAARLHRQRRPDRRARPLLRPGRRLLGLPHPQGSDALPPASGQAAKRARRGARAPLPRLEPERRHPRRAPGAGQGQLPARKRSRQVAHRPAHLRARRLPQPLAGCGHGLRGPERGVEVRVPRPPWSPRPRHQARLPRREPAFARPNREPARPDSGRPPHRRATAQLPARRRQEGARREQVRARSAGHLRLRTREPTTAATRSSSTRASLLDLPGRNRRRRGPRHRPRRRRQRLRDGIYGLGGLPHDSGRLRHDLRRAQRCVRDEARRERCHACLLDLSGRNQLRRGQRDRGRQRRQRLRGGVHGFGRLPNDRRRVRHDLQRCR